MTTSASASWITHFDAVSRQETLALLLASVDDDAMLGFERQHGEELAAFVDKLGERLSDHCWLLQGRADGVLVYSVLMERWGHPTGAHIAEIKKAIVHPGYRGNGLVSHGLQEILALARQEQIDRFVIDVRRGSRAEKLWQALGFREFGRLADYSRYLGQVYEGVFMSASCDQLGHHARPAVQHA